MTYVMRLQARDEKREVVEVTSIGLLTRMRSMPLNKANTLQQLSTTLQHPGFFLIFHFLNSSL